MGHKLIFEQDWKPWPKDPRILVSDEGDVLSYRSGSWKRLKQTDSGRYLTVGINNPTGKSYLVHRLVAETWIPKESEDLEVNHVNGNRYDNRVENLEWITHQENIDHSRKTGLVPKTVPQESELSKPARFLIVKPNVPEPLVGITKILAAVFTDGKRHILDTISKGDE